MATRKRAPAGKAGARKAATKGAGAKAAGGVRGARAGGAGRPSFKAGKPGGGRGPKAGGGAFRERKLPRRHGARRKTPPSLGREAAPPAPAPAPGQPDLSRETAVAVARAGLDKKAEAVTVYDVRGLSSYADYLVLMTADSDRQASAIADNVDAQMRAAGLPKLAVEGYESGRWIIVDYGDVVAHVMSRESREFYDLDGLWADAPRFTVEG
jgi:ribosome-associated protein